VDRETTKTSKGQSETLSLEELAASQGIKPVTEFDALLGHPSAEDESVEEFAVMLREWRREGAGAVQPR
jgi:hypothetical protein